MVLLLVCALVIVLGLFRAGGWPLVHIVLDVMAISAVLGVIIGVVQWHLESRHERR